MERALPVRSSMSTSAPCTHTSRFAGSKGDARRGIQGKGFLVNGETVAAPERTLGSGDLLHGACVMLQKGKRNHALLAVEG